MRIYNYGTLAPTENAPLIHELLLRSSRYFNHLVEIERRRRVRYDALEATAVSDGTRTRRTSCEARVEEIITEVATARSHGGEIAQRRPKGAAPKDERLATAKRALKEAREAFRAEAAPLHVAAEIVAAAREVEKLHRKEKRQRNRSDDEIVELLLGLQHACEAIGALPRSHAAVLAVQLFASDAATDQEKRSARAASALPWGCYTLVEDAFLQACQDAPRNPLAPRFQRFDGTGRIGAPQLVGVSVEDLTEDRDFHLQVLPLPEGPLGKWTTKRRHAIARVRLGTDANRDPIYASFPVLYDRPLPAGATVKRAWMLCRRIGSTFKWELQITVDEKTATTPHVPPPSNRTVAIDVGWRVTAGYRVGYLVDEEGYEEAIHAPLVSFARAKGRRKWAAKREHAIAPVAAILPRSGWKLPLAEALDYLDGIRAVRDGHFDVAVGFVREWIAGAGGKATLPDWLREATATLPKWRGHGRLASLLRRWASAPERVAGDESLLAGLRTWAEKDRHLWDWEAHGRARILSARREHYRVIAARIARDYGTILLPKIDLRKFARGPRKEEAAPSQGRQIRISQKMCAPSEFIEAIKNAAHHEGRTIIERAPINDTVTCHLCARVEVWDDPAARLHTCGCGATWDRDPNACINRLRAAGLDPARALRSCVSSQDRSQSA